MKRTQLAQKLLLQNQKQINTVIGFDGFTDEILRAVDVRDSSEDYQPISHIDQFSERTRLAAGKSCNIELVLQQRKIGGNGPILANALLETGNSAITLIGALGYPTIEPLFVPLTQKVMKAISLAPSGHTDAIEFVDGKLLFGKHRALFDITLERLLAILPPEKLLQIFEEADLFVSANWTMLYSMTDIWRYIISDIIPKLSHKQRRLFIDLADPAKRSDGDIMEALLCMNGFQKAFKVTLGVNQSEAERLLTLYSLKGSFQKESLKATCALIREKTNVDELVIHTTKYAAAATASESSVVEGPYCQTPLITTGGGDHFNAGFLNSYRYDLSLKESLLLGAVSSGYYVRTGHSPNVDDMIQFLRSWDQDPSY